MSGPREVFFLRDTPEVGLVVHGLGPRSLRVYQALREPILSGELAPGARLPSIDELALEFGIASMTVRQVIARLEQEGLVRREHGRGTFVRGHDAPPSVLVVDDHELSRVLLREYVHLAGLTPLEASGPAEALAMLEREASIALVLSDVRMPDAADGIALIRRIRHRWPDLPLAAVTGFPEDLTPLFGTLDFPVLVLPKPVRGEQLEQVLRFGLGQAGPAAPGSKAATRAARSEGANGLTR